MHISRVNADCSMQGTFGAAHGLNGRVNALVVINRSGPQPPGSTSTGPCKSVMGSYLVSRGNGTRLIWTVDWTDNTCGLVNLRLPEVRELIR